MKNCFILILVGFCILFLGSIRVEAQSYTWEQPDQELPVERKSIVLPDCDAFLKAIPTRSQIAKQENAWLGSIYYGVDWQLAETNEIDDTIGMSLALGLQDCRLKVNVYSWEGILESKMDKFYDAFYLQIKERTKLLQHVIKTGKVDESDFTNFDPLFKDSLQYYIQFFKNSLNQEDVPNLDLESFIEAMDGGINPLMYTDYGFKFKRKNGIYYFHEDDIERFLDVLYFSIAKLNHFFDAATSYGYSAKKVLDINNVDCMVCADVLTVGNDFNDEWGEYKNYFLLFDEGKYELTSEMENRLNQMAAYFAIMDSRIEIFGRASAKGARQAFSQESLGNDIISYLRAKNVADYLKSRNGDSDEQILGFHAVSENESFDESSNNSPIDRSVSIQVFDPTPPDLQGPIVTQVPKHRNVPSSEWALIIDAVFTIQLGPASAAAVAGRLWNRTNDTKAMFESYCTPGAKDLFLQAINNVSKVQVKLNDQDNMEVDMANTFKVGFGDLRTALEGIQKSGKAIGGGITGYIPTISISGNDAHLFEDETWIGFSTGSPVVFEDFHKVEVVYSSISGFGLYSFNTGLEVKMQIPSLNLNPHTVRFQTDDVYTAGVVSLSGSGIMDLLMFDK